MHILSNAWDSRTYITGSMQPVRRDKEILKIDNVHKERAKRISGWDWSKNKMDLDISLIYFSCVIKVYVICMFLSEWLSFSFLVAFYMMIFRVKKNISKITPIVSMHIQNQGCFNQYLFDFALCKWEISKNYVTMEAMSNFCESIPRIYPPFLCNALRFTNM